MFKRKRLISSYDSDSSSSDESASPNSGSPNVEHDFDTDNRSNREDKQDEFYANTAPKDSPTDNDSNINPEDSHDLNHVEAIQSPADDEEIVPALSLDAAKSQYFELFSRLELDPFDPWETQLQVLKDHSEFYVYEDEEKRREWYDEWCSKGNGEPGTYADGDMSLTSDDDLEADYTPTMYHYLAHIVSKSDLHTETIFQDIRKENKQLFKQLQIDENLTRKQQELFTSRLLYYYKHLSLAERENIFLQAVDGFPLNESFTISKDASLPDNSWNYILKI
ncbi:hypothetical protein ACO0QE_001545 [Hanseniaspora vineae]